MELERWFAENQYHERFLYIRQGHLDFFNVILCGITTPNPDYNISWENGAPCYIFDYITHGKGWIETDDQIIPVSAGDLYFYARGTRLRLYADREEPYEKLWIQLSGKLMKQLCEVYGMGGRVIVRHLDAQPQFQKITSILQKSTPATIAADMSDISAVIMGLTASLMREEVFGPQSADASYLPGKIRAMLDASLYSPIDLCVLSEQLHLTPTHIIRVFREAYGTTPKKYLSNSRIAQAKILLRETSIPIHDIADKLCYSDSQHFSSTFTKEVGCPPSTYRKK